MPQFDITTYPAQIFWLVIAFGALYLITYIFIAPTTERIIKTREEFIENNINNATALSKEVQNLKHYYDEELKKVTDKIEHIRFQALHSLDESLNIQTIKLHKELFEEEQKIQNEIDATIKRFMSTKKQASLTLANFIVNHIIQHEANQKLLESCYEKVGKV